MPRKVPDDTQEIVVIQQDEFRLFRATIEKRLSKIEEFIAEYTQRKINEAPEIPLLKSRIDALEKQVKEIQESQTWVVRIILGINIAAIIGLIIKP
jgi:polyhydroxyalkanoate synthesis regulator phasin